MWSMTSWHLYVRIFEHMQIYIEKGTVRALCSNTQFVLNTVWTLLLLFKVKENYRLHQYFCDLTLHCYSKLLKTLDVFADQKCHGFVSSQPSIITLVEHLKELIPSLQAAEKNREVFQQYLEVSGRRFIHICAKIVAYLNFAQAFLQSMSIS